MEGGQCSWSSDVSRANDKEEGEKCCPLDRRFEPGTCGLEGRSYSRVFTEQKRTLGGEVVIVAEEQALLWSRRLRQMLCLQLACVKLR